jgi:hypothetical protein
MAANVRAARAWNWCEIADHWREARLGAKADIVRSWLEEHKLQYTQ